MIGARVGWVSFSALAAWAAKLRSVHSTICLLHGFWLLCRLELGGRLFTASERKRDSIFLAIRHRCHKACLHSDRMAFPFFVFRKFSHLRLCLTPEPLLSQCDVSAGRESQLRRELKDSWEEFTSERETAVANG